MSYVPVEKEGLTSRYVVFYRKEKMKKVTMCLEPVQVLGMVSPTHKVDNVIRVFEDGTKQQYDIVFTAGELQLIPMADVKMAIADTLGTREDAEDLPFFMVEK